MAGFDSTFAFALPLVEGRSGAVVDLVSGFTASGLYGLEDLKGSTTGGGGGGWTPVRR